MVAYDGDFSGLGSHRLFKKAYFKRSDEEEDEERKDLYERREEKRFNLFINGYILYIEDYGCKGKIIGVLRGIS